MAKCPGCDGVGYVVWWRQLTPEMRAARAAWDDTVAELRVECMTCGGYRVPHAGACLPKTEPQP